MPQGFGSDIGDCRLREGALCTQFHSPLCQQITKEPNYSQKKNIYIYIERERIYICLVSSLQWTLPLAPGSTCQDIKRVPRALSNKVSYLNRCLSTASTTNSFFCLSKLYSTFFARHISGHTTSFAASVFVSNANYDQGWPTLAPARHVLKCRSNVW